MTVTTRRERRQQKRRQEQRRSGGSGGGGGARGIGQVWVIAVVVVAIVALILIGRAAGVFEPPAGALDVNSPQFDPAGQTIGVHQDEIGKGHVNAGQAVAYPSLPPTSGDHWSQSGVAPAPWGVKTASIPFEVTTHNLEHGGVVILYASDLSTAQVDTLRGIVRDLGAAGFPKIILEPWPAMKDAKVILTSWNWILKLPGIDQTQIVKFVRIHHASSEAPEPTVP
jgi:hypothetical protein